MYTFVLVHGAWHDGTAWRSVIRHLTGMGHTAFAPTVAGHGKEANKNVSHAQSVQSIVDFIVEEDLRDVVLVGHSYGGTIIQKVVERLPDRIRRLVFHSAFVLADGESLFDNVPPEARPLFDAMIANLSSDNPLLPVPPFPLWRELFIQDADMKTALWSYEQLSPEPPQFMERIPLATFYDLVRSGRIGVSYLNCTEDLMMQNGTTQKLLARLGVFRFVQMPGSHEVMFSNPAGLAKKLVEAGRE